MTSVMKLLMNMSSSGRVIVNRGKNLDVTDRWQSTGIIMRMSRAAEYDNHQAKTRRTHHANRHRTDTAQQSHTTQNKAEVATSSSARPTWRWTAVAMETRARAQRRDTRKHTHTATSHRETPEIGTPFRFLGAHKNQKGLHKVHSGVGA